MSVIYDPAELRADLHEMPELAMQEVRTAAYAAEKLEALGLKVERGVGGTTGLTAVIEGTEPGPVVMLRADMDALPFVIDGKDCAIHACGHDAHTAMLLAAASRLVGKVKRGKLKLVLQPAEETCAGAKALIAAGILDDVDYVLGAHIRPIQDLPAGKVCSGVRHTASYTFRVTVKGRGAHAARPHLGVNAIDAGGAIVAAVQAIWLNPTGVWSAKATQFHADAGGTNIVPDRATITFDVRAQTNELMNEYQEKIKAAIEYAAKAHGAEAEIETLITCPAAVYDEDFKAEVGDAICEVLGDDALAADCGGGGEDFHCYKLAKPSMKAAYFGVGVGATPGLHAPNMTFDPKYLINGVKVFEAVVLKHLG